MNETKIFKKLLASKKEIFDFSDLKKILLLKNDNSVYQSIKRLKKNGLISSLKNGRYFLSENKPEDFLIANNIYSPSYISLETALNYYGILIQVPYTIFSVTTRKKNSFECLEREFEYLHISQSYFFDYIKERGFLIATPEKALIDTIFFNALGKRKTDFDELVMENINKKRLHKLKGKIKNQAFHRFFEKLKI